jgi:hypothetical protein
MFIACARCLTVHTLSQILGLQKCAQRTHSHFQGMPVICGQVRLNVHNISHSNITNTEFHIFTISLHQRVFACTSLQLARYHFSQVRNTFNSDGINYHDL